jgi:hypothetical protein
MNRLHTLVLLLIGAIAWVGFDLVRTLQTGRARGRWGTITRLHRPEKFWRYVYASCAGLAVCVVVLIWIIVSPESWG